MRVFLLLGMMVPLCVGTLCPNNKYWSSNLEKCIDCSKCKEDQFISRPCQLHKDTECSPVSDLLSDMKSYPPWLHHDETKHFDKSRIHFLDDIVIPERSSHHNHRGGGHIEDFLSAPEQAHKTHNRPDKHRTEHHHKKKVRNRPSDNIDIQKHRHYEFASDDEDAFNLKIANSEFLNIKKPDVFPAHIWKKYEEIKNPHLSQIKDEKELQKWLIKSRNKLKHRKDDLMKIVKEEHLLSQSDDDETRIKLNHPIYKLDAKLIQDLLNHESHSNKSKKHQPNISDLDLKIFQELVTEEKNKDSELINLMSKSPKKSSQDYKPVVPAHRMFLGEPSTVSEIIGQVKDPQEVIKEEFGKNVILERSKISVLPFVNENEDVVSVPFSTAERFVSDWQVVAFVSAIVSCLLFFVVAIIYTILNARQWRRVKIRYEVGE
jgi:hypothetical protein